MTEPDRSAPLIPVYDIERAWTMRGARITLWLRVRYMRVMVLEAFARPFSWKVDDLSW